MLARLTRRFLALSVAAAAVTGVVLPGSATAAQITIAPGDVTFEQWSRDNTPGWTTGNVGKNYTEGDVIPFRLTVTNAGTTPAGDSFLFSICRDFEEPAAPATVERNGYLRIENYDTTIAAGLEGATEGNTIAGVTGAGEGATVQILNVTDDTSPATGDCAPGQRETEVEFTISDLNGADKAYVLWGGRLASPYDAEVTPRDGASTYSGSSLHMTFFPSKTLSANASQIDAATPPPPPPAPATLTVAKHVVNDDGGTLNAADFTMNLVGTDVSDASFPGSEAGTTVTLAAGTYSVTEEGPAGYVGSLSSGCSGTIAPGQNVTCTITNDDVAPTLTVVKHVVNDDGGTLGAADFTMNVDGTDVSDASFPGSEAGTTVTLAAGTYSVTENGPAGYVGSSSSGCSGTIALGQNVTCTITNDDVDDTTAPGPDPDPVDDNLPSGDDDDDSGTTNPPADTQVDSATQTNSNPALPVQAVPVATLPATSSPEAPGPQAAPTLVAELPRTGAGVREQSLLALVLLGAGLLSSALGRRRTRPSDV